MPIYEYRCMDCGKTSEIFLRAPNSGSIECPFCGSKNLTRLLSASYAIRMGASMPGRTCCDREQRGARRPLVLQKVSAVGSERMNLLELEPRYSIGEVPGYCLKCLAKQECEACEGRLLRGGGKDKELEQRYEVLGSFLKSPELGRLVNESEKYLAREKKPKLIIYSNDGRSKYELRLS